MAKAKPQVIYSVDSSSLIHGWRRAYPPKNFPKFWKLMDSLIDEMRLFSSVEVLKELKKKDDDVYHWCKDRSGIFLPIDDQLQVHVGHVMGIYPRLADTAKGRNAADPFVIATARKNGSGWTVLTEENPGKVRIPEVCKAEGINCIRLLELIQNEDWIVG